MPPKILIPIPTTSDADYNQRSWPTYAEAVRQAGGEPVELSLSASSHERMKALAGISGIVLPGSPADVDPARYGHPRVEDTAAADLAREATDWFLLEEADVHKIPLLAICFGMQSLNVFRGGTLIQHLPGVPVNHGAGGQVAIAHSVAVVPGSLLATLVDPLDCAGGNGSRLPVNSSHHQAVAVTGGGLQVTARSTEDGVIEAVESIDPASFLLAVQWHPERSTAISGTSRRIFGALIAAAINFDGLSRP